MFSSLFMQISLVLALGAVVSICMRLLKQPLIIGYILTGLIAGPAGFNIIHNHADFDTFSQIGIVLLLFIVGLGLNFSLIRSTGRPAFVIFLSNLALVGFVCLGAGYMFNFTVTESLLLGLGLTLSSTIVVVKSLSDMREQHRLHGRLIVGVLLVEDLAATVALVLLSAAGKGGGWDALITLALRGLLLALCLVLVSWVILPKLVKFFAASQEFLFGFALAWAFSIAGIFEVAGFSVEVGALFAGVSLASLPYAQEISTRLKPLRDFFLLLFFISMGGHLSPNGITQAIIPALVCVGIVTLIKPTSAANVLGIFRYTKQTSFKAATHLTQVSEFSIVMLTLARNQGLIGDHVVTVITLTALFSIATSTYLMQYDGSIYRAIGRLLPIIERAIVTNRKDRAVVYKRILFGYRRGGHEFVRTFKQSGMPFVVVDYNPEIVDLLEQQGTPVVYGDATDYELLEEIGAHNAELIVSILPGLHNNLTLLQYLQRKNRDVIFICHANDYDDAATLYEEGASYVMLPHFIGSEKMSAFIRKHGTNKAAFDDYRQKHIITLGKAAII